LGNRLRLILTV